MLFSIRGQQLPRAAMVRFDSRDLLLPNCGQLRVPCFRGPGVTCVCHTDAQGRESGATPPTPAYLIAQTPGAGPFAASCSQHRSILPKPDRETLAHGRQTHTLQASPTAFAAPPSTAAR